MSVYENTPVGYIRKMMASGQDASIGDPRKMARAMIASVDKEVAPKRLTLGSDAYTLITVALKTRLADLEAQKEVAFSTTSTE